MKNNIKKLFSTIIVFLMAVALVMPVGASDKVDPKDNPEIDVTKTTGSITMKKKGSQFSVYKVLDATAKAGQKVFTYSKNSAFESFFENEAYGNFTIEKIAELPNELNIRNEDGTITDPIKETVKLTTPLQKFIEDNGVQPVATITCPNDGTAVTVDNLGIGFYLIVETATHSDSASVASKSMLVPLPIVEGNKPNYSWNYNLNITPKDEPVPLDKNIRKQNGEKFELVSSSTNNIGDILEYQVDTAIPHYDDKTDIKSIKYIITDTLSAGLDFVNQDKLNIVVADFSGNNKTLVKDVDYTIEYNGRTMTINFVYPNIMAYNTLQLRYNVVINENAIVGGGANPNKVELEYTNNPNTGTTSKPWDETKTYTYGIQILKHDVSDENVRLAGAAFELQDEEGNVIAAYEYDKEGKLIIAGDGNVETDEEGLAYFVGLEAGTYYLKETKAPEGYQILDGRATLVIEADLETGNAVYTLNGTVIAETTAIENGGSASKVVVTKFANTKGFNLPKTGGAGTWMFTVGGILIMASMVTVFVKLRKKEN
ncbi:SpaH/EbpB family LPXTG-anchored major pilin [Thomasclavelia cocleata]|jgi:fimbrial isopeptide formation D2 family protein/LPXTG-motif cell wall-anchored protein|uniref:SpaH/EbpB family LPXTG-anchored major pilin n=1 Tax=Thomasclavelia cocleata TaxID=69824 RepID=UPI00241FFEAD|nr:SpaH/EbpB family LPXTG-anchored major pilin [Thomasclavelia cocleata]